MRPIAIALMACAALPLGALQVSSSVALRARADALAWPRAVPPAFAARVDGLTPRVPLPPALRLVLARTALARGDLPLAERDAAALPAGRDRLALEGGLAEERGDPAAAARAFIAAGDVAAVEQQVDALAAHGRVSEAVTMQRTVVDRLASDPTRAVALAQALFDLGRIDETNAYRFALGDPERRLHETEAARAYERAVALAPLEERYVIAYANQELNLGDIPSAERAFVRARDEDPTSAEPVAGLGDAAFRRGDTLSARAYLERARTLDPASAAVAALARKLGP